MYYTDKITDTVEIRMGEGLAAIKPSTIPEVKQIINKREWQK